MPENLLRSSDAEMINAALASSVVSSPPPGHDSYCKSSLGSLTCRRVARCDTFWPCSLHVRLVAAPGVLEYVSA
eukprot:3939656-Rhodomonas_salina.3